MSSIFRDVIYSIYEVLISEENKSLKRDSEFYYLVGQIVGYIIDRSELDNRENIEIERFIYLKDSKEIKKNLKLLYEKYHDYLPKDHDIIIKGLKEIYAYQINSRAVNKNIIFTGYLGENIIEYILSPKKYILTE